MPTTSQKNPALETKPIEVSQQRLAGKRRARLRGVVMVEYSTLLLLIGIPASIGVVVGGLALAQQYAATRQTILNSSP
jgi:transcriptional regulator of nitric oxide reductase